MAQPSQARPTNEGCMLKGELIALQAAEVVKVNVMHNEKAFTFDLTFTGLGGSSSRQFPVSAIYADPKVIATQLAGDGFIVLPGKERAFQVYLAYQINNQLKLDKEAQACQEKD